MTDDNLTATQLWREWQQARRTWGDGSAITREIQRQYLTVLAQSTTKQATFLDENEHKQGELWQR